MKPAALGYLQDQLIAYIGNKRKLLDLIDQAVQKTGVRQGVFFDAFAGSGVVSRLAKVRGHRVICNDWEPYTRCLNSVFVGQNRLPAFCNLGGVESVYQTLNSLQPLRGYIATHYCPQDDHAPDLERERLFFTQQNGQRLDAAREAVEEWKASGLLTVQEYDTLVASLIFATSWCSNTSGVFKGFHRGWGGATGTAWYRIKAPVLFRAPVLWDNAQQNLVYQEDASELAGRVQADIAYLDPPYNQHQYGSNYHLLNTMALWDKPEISPTFSPGTRGIKAAIRLDWRQSTKSSWCRSALAKAELEKLVGRLNAKWILLSYSTDGIIPVEDLIETLGRAGRLSWVWRPYKRYRVSSQRPSPRPHTLEFVLMVDTSRPACPETQQEILDICQNNAVSAGNLLPENGVNR